ncbi:phosphoribosyltransferase family protein [Ruminococcus sp. YE282]|uniref:phosphoribosyltransferase family protein n=1 Tax=Ruminococcus sp. YE282 TaxID=3158780 RepID=UPI00088C3624|nr:Predicted phosphoribosyltransferase [Ruminococcus bromii]
MTSVNCVVEKEISIYVDRKQAGLLLYDIIQAKIRNNTEIVTIPNGGVGVSYEISKKSNKISKLVLSKKIVLDKIPIIGIGALTKDKIILNHDRIKRLNLSNEEIKRYINNAKKKLREDIRLFSNYIVDRKHVAENKIILIDDGVSSGYTIKAALSEILKYNPSSIIVATPIISNASKSLIEKMGVDVISPYISTSPKFVVDEYYDSFKDVSKSDVIKILSKGVVCK